MPPRPNVDFLIVVALRAEFDAVARHFGPLEAGGREHFATVPRLGGGEYRVAIVNIGAMGPAPAQRETTEALSRVRSQRVILLGIAAGFPEDGVGYGDLMIPQWIADYELAKVREKRSWYGRKKLVVDHRANAERISQSLFHTAQTVADNPDNAWAIRITVDRPDGERRTPEVFSTADVVMGSGSKVVASQLYEARLWLRQQHPGKILGLEMEAIGVIHACQPKDVQCLVVKASQDPATALKDDAAEKDIWRPYACDVAAAFVRELVGVYQASIDSVIATHFGKLDTITQGTLAREYPEFDYRVDLAQSYSDVKRQHFQAQGSPLNAILPNDGTPLVALLGGGGTGKSNIARRLVRQVKTIDQCPLLFDLSKYEGSSRHELKRNAWQELDPGDRARISAEILGTLIQQTSVPQHSIQEIQFLARETEVVSIVDGLNEVPPIEQALILDFLKGLKGVSRPKLLVMTRFGDREALRGFSFASVSGLGRDEVKEVYDRYFGKENESAYDKLDPRVQEILRRPFFLALAMRGQELDGLRNWSDIFERFFDERLRIGTQRLDAIAKAAFDSLDFVGGINVVAFRSNVGEREYRHLVAAEVIDREERGFDHELWRDFLASRHLSKEPTLWVDDHFDGITVKASSFESLALTIEQIADPKERDSFVKAVYDWSLPGAVACLEYGDGADKGDVSKGLRIAILAAIADRTFDPIEHSRENAHAQLSEQPSAEAARFSAAQTHEELVAAVRQEGVQDAWFDEWLKVFELADGESVPDQIVQLVRSPDPILGWAVSNALRRVALTDRQTAILIDIYNGEIAGSRAVRWRIVHTLGSVSQDAAIQLLANALTSDQYMWVRYGAARSLVEIAAANTGAARQSALAALSRALPAVSRSTIIERYHVLRQVLGAATTSRRAENWVNDFAPLLDLVVQLSDDSRRDELLAGIARLRTGI
jgi:nucleoside phosphorylase